MAVCQRSGLNPSRGASLDVVSQMTHPWAGSSTSRPMVPLQSAAEKADHPLVGVEGSQSTHLQAHDQETHFVKMKSPETMQAEAAAFQNSNWKEIRSVVPQGECGTASVERYPMDRRGYVTYAAHFPSPLTNQCGASKAEAQYWFPQSWKTQGAPQYIPGTSGFLRGPYGGANL